MVNITLKDFLKASKQVTDNYVKAWGKWSLTDQWNKIEEEDEEFKYPKNSLNELEEFWDCFFARLTLLHLKGVNDYAILESAKSTLCKITERSKRV